MIIKKTFQLKLILSIFLLIYCKTDAQTRFLNCNANTPIQNARVINNNTKEWMGNTDEYGEITIPRETSSILVTHPDFGNININTLTDIICLDSNSSTLKELVIESGTEVKKQLLVILENSYKKFKKDNKGKDYYKIDFNLSEGKKKIETFNGILGLGSLLSTTINNYKLHFNKETHYQDLHKKLPSFEYISHIEEAIFTDKKSYNKIKDFVNKNKIQKINNEIIVSNITTDDYITFTINEEKQLIEKYQNTEVLKREKPSYFSSTDWILMGNVEAIYHTASNYHINTLKVQERYKIDDITIQSNSYINQLKLTKEEQNNLNGKGVIGFAIDYVNQKDK